MAASPRKIERMNRRLLLVDTGGRGEGRRGDQPLISRGQGREERRREEQELRITTCGVVWHVTEPGRGSRPPAAPAPPPLDHRAGSKALASLSDNWGRQGPSLAPGRRYEGRRPRAGTGGSPRWP